MDYRSLVPGRVIEAGSYTVTEEEIREFAIQYDPQWFHTDPQRAAASRWNGLIASGWHTCAIAMRLAVQAVLSNSQSIGSPGVEQVRWPSPLRPGMRVTLHIEVLENRISSSGDRGVVRWRWRMTNEAGVSVLDLIATSFFELKSVAAQ